MGVQCTVSLRGVGQAGRRSQNLQAAMSEKRTLALNDLWFFQFTSESGSQPILLTKVKVMQESFADVGLGQRSQ